MAELEKYKLVFRSYFADNANWQYLQEINALAEVGYRVHTFDWDYTLMSLKTDPKYDNISNLKDLDPQMVDEYLAQGWIVADSYSKFIRMVKKAEDSNDS